MALRLNGTDPFLRAAIGAFNGYVFGNQPSSFATCLKRNSIGTWQGVHVIDAGSTTNVSYPMEFNPSNNIVQAMSTGDGGRVNGTAITDTTNFMIVGWTWDGTGGAGSFVLYWKIGAGAWNSATPTPPTPAGSPTFGSGYRHLIGNEAALADDGDFDWLCSGGIKSNLSAATFQTLDMASIATWDAVFTGSSAWLLDGQTIASRTDRTGNGGDELSRSASVTLVSDPAGFSWGAAAAAPAPRTFNAIPFIGGGL